MAGLFSLASPKKRRRKLPKIPKGLLKAVRKAESKKKFEQQKAKRIAYINALKKKAGRS